MTSLEGAPGRLSALLRGTAVRVPGSVLSSLQRGMYPGASSAEDRALRDCGEVGTPDSEAMPWLDAGRIRRISSVSRSMAWPSLAGIARDCGSFWWLRLPPAQPRRQLSEHRATCAPCEYAARVSILKVALPCW